MSKQETGSRNTALIIGASSGIGYELAKVFAKDHNLVLIARNREMLEKIGSQLQEEHEASILIISKDLALPDSPREIFEEPQDRSIQVDYLVNNAGYGLQGLFWELDARRQLDMIQVNMTALVHLTRLFLPGMIDRGHGGVLNVASTAAFVPGPLMIVYYASKAFVLSFTEGLHNELRKTGVTATVLCPGPTRTEFQKRAGIESSGLYTSRNVMDAEPVAKLGYRGLMSGKRVIVAGLTNRVQISLAKAAPGGQVIKLVRRRNERRKPVAI